jgi:hypothetical protein
MHQAGLGDLPMHRVFFATIRCNGLHPVFTGSEDVGNRPQNNKVGHL